MKRNDMKSLIDDLAEKVNVIANDEVRDIQKSFLNIIEFLMKENSELREENQKLRDENNRLKGEQGKPIIRKQAQRKMDVSSEPDRKKQEKKKKKMAKKKKHKIKIKHKKVCVVNKDQLPADAIFKGYQSVVVQDILIETDNTEFKKEVYYSPSLNKSLTAQLPSGYQGEFGPGIKALVIELHHNSKMTESSIHRFLTNQSILISPATISRIITDNLDAFHQEKSDIVMAGLASSSYQQMDDTGARVSGVNHYTHILCNPLYTAFFTQRRKDRLTIINILTQGEMRYLFNDISFSLMETMNLPEKQLTRLKIRISNANLNREEINLLLDELFPHAKKHTANRRIILEASAISAYQQLPHAIDILMTDDAPQFKQITKLLALCWVHDARHYKKLMPFVQWHKVLLRNFLSQYWTFYHKLLEYKDAPSEPKASSLEKEFDALFSTNTGYDQLDERIAKSKLKKTSLLLVLDDCSLPLHNNASELGARVQARYRDISFHTINEKGTSAKDTFMTIVQTAKKLSVNTYAYFVDRVTQNYMMPSLASIITERSAVVDTS